MLLCYSLINSNFLFKFSNLSTAKIVNKKCYVLGNSNLNLSL